MADSNSNGGKPKKKKRQYSEEELERRRQQMIKLREEGKVGPQFGKLGGRPKKPRATELLAQEAEKHKDELLAVLKDGIDPSQNTSTRLRALEQWLNIERDERKTEMEEEEHDAKMSRDELMTEFSKRLNSNPMLYDMFMKAMRGEVPGAIPVRVPNEEPQDAEVVDDEPD